MATDGYDKMQGCKKSSSRSAPMEKSTGNTGKAIGDRGTKGTNSKTRQAADRYR